MFHNLSKKMRESGTPEIVAVPQSLTIFKRNVKDGIVFNDPYEGLDGVEYKWMQCLEFGEKKEGELLDDESDSLYEDKNDDWHLDVVDKVTMQW